MSTLAGRQINVMMRLKIHFQIIQNLAQVTNYSLFSLFSVHKMLILQSSPKNLHPCDQNYLQKQNMYKKCASTEGKGNYNVDHAANFKQQIVSYRWKCLSSERETV